MLEILLIRHGQTDWNRDRRIMGQRPIPLNEVGREEAAKTAQSLKDTPLDAVYSSPVLRAMETAEFLLQGRGLALHPAPHVAEIDYGDWIGKTFDEVMGEEAFHIYHKTPHHAQPPGGEKMLDVYRRSTEFIEELRKKHPGGRVAVVSHADVIKTILVHYLNLQLNDILKLRIDNGSLSLLCCEGGRVRVHTINYLPFLGKLFSPDQLRPPR
jgi:2,3-bisphosphoglycerate-dependent phosphoglycerate mutase